MSHLNMSSKKWRTVDVLVAFLILYACKLEIPCAAAELSSSKGRFSAKSIVDRYRCENENSVDTSTAVAYSQNSTSGFINETTTSGTGIKLNCSGLPFSYKNIPEHDFVSGIHDNGALELLPHSRKLEPSTFCVADHNGTTVRVALCDQPVDHNKQQIQQQHNHVHLEEHRNNPNYDQNILTSQHLRLRKCCPEMSKLTKHTENGQESFKCVATNEKWKPAIFNSTSDEFSQHVDLDKFTKSSITVGFPPRCSNLQKSLQNSKDIWFMMLASDSVEIGLKFWFKPVWLPVHDNEFCLDEFVDHDPPLPNETRIDSHAIYHKNQILLYCDIPNFDDYLFHRRLFGGMCVAAATIVFVLLIIYVAIWDKQNLAGWSQFNIFVALFFVVLMEGLRTLFDVDALQVESTTTCVIIAAIAQYFFFALNTTWSVMCFDLFYMFWKLETTSKTVARYRNRLIGYLLFSWGLPFVVVCIAFYLTHHTMMDEMNHLEGVYAFAHRRCSSPIRKLGFQTQGIMFLLNLMFFFLTTLLIWKHRRGLNAARKRSRNERHTWRSVCLFVKLVVVMGVASLSIPVDFFFVSSAPLSSTAICFRMVHFIPFVAVLFIFGFNEKNMILISQKYPRVGKYFGFVACTSGATASDTVNHSRSVNRISDHPSTPT